jgi:uncharacterized membrane protein
MHGQSLSAALGAVLLTAPPGALAQNAPCTLPFAYEVVELPGLGGPNVQALSLDASWTSRAVLWTNLQAANLSASVEGGAWGIASDGRVAGWQRSGSDVRGILWSGGDVQYLSALSGHASCVAADVNRHGSAAGWSTNSKGDSTAAGWRDGRVRSLTAGQSVQPYASYAFAINDAETIVGRGHFSSVPTSRALAWTPSGTRVLPGLGGGSDGATAVSPSGLIVGGSVSAVTGKFHAVLWKGQGVRDLGLYRGVHTTAAFGVNDCGVAVGEAVVDIVNGRTVALVWQNGRVRDLNRLITSTGWVFHTARAVNSRGEILGYGSRAGLSGIRAFLLMPVY